jgi:cytochrome b subunit of formate dehydrogenase
LWTLAVPAWLLAQEHGGRVGPEHGGASSAERAAKERELAGSVHKDLDCSDCHGEMAMEMGVGRVNPVSTCARCHAPETRSFLPSVHGVAFRRGVEHAATCVECHGSHSVQPTKSAQSPVLRLLSPTETCARCHESLSLTETHRLPAIVVPDYRSSFHGLSAAQGDQRVANCASCHGYHEIRPSRDPLSTVNPANLARTCGACHVGTTAGFASGGVHHRPDTPGHNLVDLARVMYLMMIGVTVSLMLAHNGLDFWGRLRERLRRKGKSPEGSTSGTHGSVPPLTPAGDAVVSVRPASNRRSNKSPVYLRFTFNERVQHWTLAASFILLAVTGFALKFAWRFPGLEAQQSVLLRGFLHRAAGVVFIALAVYHVGYMTLSRRGRYNLRALVPRVRSASDFLCRCAACFRLGPPSVSDWRNLIQTVKYNLGLAPERPVMGRFTYAEKMEYLALVWGSAVMVATGLALWFEVPFLNRFPYWAIELATTVHYYEAVLATLSIVVWHFYYTIFNPDVFPLSKTMVTGRISREEMERDHALELRALESEASSKERGSEREESRGKLGSEK